MLDFGEVGGLDFEGQSDKLLLERILRRSIEHLGFDFRGFRGPVNEEDLVSLSSLNFEFKVVDDVSAVVGGESFEEVGVVLVLRGRLNNDFLVVVSHFVRDELVLVVELEVVVFGDARVVNCYTACLFYLFIYLFILNIQEGKKSLLPSNLNYKKNRETGMGKMKEERKKNREKGKARGNRK